MINYIYILIIVFSFSLPQITQAQQKPLQPTISAVYGVTNKTLTIIYVTYNSTMYLSEIDKLLMESSQITSKQLILLLRNGFDFKLTDELAKQYKVINLLRDTTKEIINEAQKLLSSMKTVYVKTPNQLNYIVPTEEKPEKVVNKGYLDVDLNSDNKFMDAKCIKKSGLKYFKEVYHANVFLFINELDIKIKNSMYQDLQTTGQRKIVLHYTLMDINGKELNSGTVETNFSKSINKYNVIINQQFVEIAKILNERISKYLIKL